MKIKHKYLRNRHFRIKNWKRIRNTEHPFQTFYPYMWGEYILRWDHESQVKDHFEWITNNARMLESGGRRGSMKNAPAYFRRTINRQRKAQERHVLGKIRNGDYDAEIPTFKNDAAWLYW